MALNGVALTELSGWTGCRGTVSIYPTRVGAGQEGTGQDGLARTSRPLLSLSRDGGGGGQSSFVFSSLQGLPGLVQGRVVVVGGDCDRAGTNRCVRPTVIATGDEGQHDNGRRSLFFLRCRLP